MPEKILRLLLEDDTLNSKLDNFEYDGFRITNFEMETSVIYGLSKLLGHKAVSLNAVIANRATATFSEDYRKVVRDLITYTLNKFID